MVSPGTDGMLPTNNTLLIRFIRIQYNTVLKKKHWVAYGTYLNGRRRINFGIRLCFLLHFNIEPPKQKSLRNDMQCRNTTRHDTTQHRVQETQTQPSTKVLFCLASSLRGCDAGCQQATHTEGNKHHGPDIFLPRKKQICVTGVRRVRTVPCLVFKVRVIATMHA